MPLTHDQVEELVEDWAVALESGAYKQRKGNLCSVASDGSKTYCCLGVLTELVKEKYQLDIVEIINTDSDILYKWTNPETRTSSLTSAYVPKSLCEYIGLDEPSGLFPVEGGHNEMLTIINDRGGKFSTIANIIRENKAGLFPILST